MAYWQNGAVPWNSLDDNTRAPLASEFESGYPCGEADQALFNWTAGYPVGQIWNVILNSGIAPNPAKLLDLAQAIQSQKLNFGTAAGAANAVTVTLAPAPLSLNSGLWLRLKVTTTNTQAVTLNVNGLGAKSVIRIDGDPLVEGDLTTDDMAELVYDGAAWRLVSFCRSLLPKPLTANQTFFLDAAAGNDANNGLTAGTAFRTFDGAWTAVQTRYAPSDKYSINFKLAPGTYNAPFFSGYSGQINVVGDKDNRTAYKLIESPGLNYCARVTHGSVEFQGVTFESRAAPGVNVLMVWVGGGNGNVTLRNCELSIPTSNSALIALYAGASGLAVRETIRIIGGASVASSISAVVSTGDGALFSGGLFAEPCVWSFYNLSMGQAWSVCGGLAYQSWLGMSFSNLGGVASGRRYDVNNNGVISTGGGGETFLPGTIAGVTSSGGIYT